MVRKELSRSIGLVLNSAMNQSAQPIHHTLNVKNGPVNACRPNPAQLAILLLAVLCVAGCVPMRYTSGPGAKGRVVDANSHAPIPGAFVALTRARGADAQTTTSSDGKFQIRSRRQWYMLNLFHASASKPMLQPAVLTITGSSYQTFATNSPPGVNLLDVGEIRLQPLSK